MGRNYGPEHITSHSGVLNANREIFDKADRQFYHRLLNKRPLSPKLEMVRFACKRSTNTGISKRELNVF